MAFNPRYAGPDRADRRANLGVIEPLEVEIVGGENESFRRHPATRLHAELPMSCMGSRENPTFNWPRRVTARRA